MTAAELTTFTARELASVVDLDVYAVRAEAERRQIAAEKAMAKAQKAMDKARAALAEAVMVGEAVFAEMARA